MTKAQEIEKLRQFAASVPTDSYIGMFLKHVLPQFEQDTRNDFPCLADVREVEASITAAQLRLDVCKQNLRTTEARLTTAQQELHTVEFRLCNARHTAATLVRTLGHLAAA